MTYIKWVDQGCWGSSCYYRCSSFCTISITVSYSASLCNAFEYLLSTSSLWFCHTFLLWTWSNITYDKLLISQTLTEGWRFVRPLSVVCPGHYLLRVCLFVLFKLPCYCECNHLTHCCVTEVSSESSLQRWTEICDQLWKKWLTPPLLTLCSFALVCMPNSWSQNNPRLFSLMTNFISNILCHTVKTRKKGNIVCPLNHRTV